MVWRPGRRRCRPPPAGAHPSRRISLAMADKGVIHSLPIHPDNNVQTVPPLMVGDETLTQPPCSTIRFRYHHHHHRVQWHLWAWTQ